MLTRHPANPILTASDVPYNARLVFNAGIAKIDGKYIMVFRNDWGDIPFRREPWGVNLGLATSDDGVHWTVKPEPVWEYSTDEIERVYDPRITVVDGQKYLCFAVDTKHGVRGGIATTEDFEHFEIQSMSVPDNRNMVLFPERIDGKLARLERPFPVYSRGVPESFDIWYAESPDCKFWGNEKLVLGAEQVPWCNSKIGPGAPPIKTDRGWLAVFHAVSRDERTVLKGWEPRPWHKTYMAGLLLLDLEQPWKVIGMSRQPLLKPETNYEVDGFRGSVIFPGGMILEDDGTVKIYYGAADTVMAMATAPLTQLLDACEPFPIR